MRRSVLAIAAACIAAGCAAPPAEVAAPATDSLRDPREARLRNVRQLTFGGENAEGYWSADGARIIFQSTRDGAGCDQIYVMDADGGNPVRLSNGQGKCTCSYFFPDGQRILYASTHLASPACPPRPDYSKGYVWRLDDGFEIFTARADGTGVERLTDHPGYDAEATVSPDGRTIVFTSRRDGDLDLYTMAPDGSGVRRITHAPGYDGGAFFSPDGTRLVWRASRPKTEAELAAYQDLLATSSIRPMALELYVAAADGSGARQVTSNGAANFGPYFFPDGRRIIFSSNLGSPGSREFDLWMIADDGTGLERVTFTPEFDGFPMFSPDGTKLLFASNRNARTRGETNLFVADWVDTPGP
jgi:Tol biopolymer transport system component